jgi:hypothetical protein
VNTVLPAVTLGRGATNRVATEASSGRTWYLAICPQQLLYLLELGRIGGSNIVVLRPVICDVVEFPGIGIGGILDSLASSSQGGPIGIVLNIQPSW